MSLLRVARRYDVFFHVNVTDIDDKIILRARQNHVLDVCGRGRARDGARGASRRSRPRVADAMALAKAKLDKKSAELAAPLPAATRSGSSRRTRPRRRSTASRAVRGQGERARGAGGDAAALFAAARSELGALLDKERGNAVTDHAIFDAHARKYEREFCDDMAALGVRPLSDALTRVTE